MMKLLVSSLILLACVGCASQGVKVEQSDESLGELKKAITAVVGEPRQLSQNQREYTTAYFDKPWSKLHRYYYVITILGARRPYTIEIHAYLEKKFGKDTYKPVGEDTALAEKLSVELQSKLNQSREGRNLIDGFRAF